jgi:hypothetical protein
MTPSVSNFTFTQDFRYIRSGIFKVVKIHIVVLWVMIPPSLLDWYRRFGGTYILKMEAADSFETVVSDKTTWCHCPAEHDMYDVGCLRITYSLVHYAFFVAKCVKWTQNGRTSVSP